MIPLVLTISLYVVWRFAKAVEDVGFKKRISVKKLKVGDVLISSKRWEGIKEEELRKIRRSGRKFVVVKEGVRFAAAFPLALLFTLYYGDGIFLFIKFLI